MKMGSLKRKRMNRDICRWREMLLMKMLGSAVVSRQRKIIFFEKQGM